MKIQVALLFVLLCQSVAARELSAFYTAPGVSVTTDGLRVTENRANLKIQLKDGAGTVQLADKFAVRVAKSNNRVQSIVDINSTGLFNEAFRVREASATQLGPDGVLVAQTSCTVELSGPLNSAAKVDRVPGCITISPDTCQKLVKYFGDLKSAKEDAMSCLQSSVLFWGALRPESEEESQALHARTLENMSLIAGLHNDIASRAADKLDFNKFVDVNSTKALSGGKGVSDSSQLFLQISKVINMCQASAPNWAQTRSQPPAAPTASQARPQ